MLRHPEGSRILLLRGGGAFALPRAQAANAWVGNARAIVPAFERRLGAKPWLLRQLRLDKDESRRRTEMVLEFELLDPRWQPPRHGRWVDRSDLARVRLANEDHASLLDDYLDALERNDVPKARAPWARPGWHGEVWDWVQATTATLGHRPLALEQVKHWSISSVLRVVTDGPDLYFKVAAFLPLFVNEATVSAALAGRFPGYVPEPLAIEPERGWMLLPAFSGFVESDAPLALKCAMFRRFASLQRRAATSIDALLADGCLDRRPEVLEVQLDALLADLDSVGGLTVQERSDLRDLGPVLKDSIRRLGGLGPPPTLVHGDLHPGNVAQLGAKLVYFDWTDACVAHPFVDLHSLRWETDESVRTALLEAYLDSWAGVASAERLREAALVATVVVPLHHAVSYWKLVGALEPSARRELDATHSFLREALLRAREL